MPRESQAAAQIIHALVLLTSFISIIINIYMFSNNSRVARLLEAMAIPHYLLVGLLANGYAKYLRKATCLVILPHCAGRS